MLKLKAKDRQNLILLLLALICSWVLLFWQLPDKRFHLYFLDIGQGDSILIKTPGNHQILVDGGPGNAVIGQLAEVMPFFDRDLDFLVLTHPDADHMQGLTEVLGRFKVKNILISGVLKDTSGYKEFLRRLNDSGARIFIARSDLDFRFGDVFMDVLYPFNNISGSLPENANNSSVTVRVGYLEHSVFLSGDLEIDGEAELIRENPGALKSEIFKAGHHGSKTSSSMALLQLVKPDIAVISVGADNSYGHPAATTIRNLYRAGVKKIYRTDLDGRVEFVF